jgi:pyridoxal/pyridoxine/pyridoxamine kinase
MKHITKIAAVETTSAIWEYDPILPDNRLLNGSLDVIAAIRTLAIKVCDVITLFIVTISHL